MDSLGISAYGTSGASSSQETAASGERPPAESSGSTLGMDEFLRLLAAQFQNQDIMNPTDNTEFISELAQFSSLQAMSTLAGYADRQYAASLVGKTVVVGQYDRTGTYAEHQGVVQSAYFSADGSTVVVDGTAYKVASVIQVVQGTSGSQETDPSGTNTEGQNSAAQGA